jgi:hypothetical protein
VWRSHLLGLSISSNTSVHHAVATREPALDNIMSTRFRSFTDHVVVPFFFLDV